MKSGAELQQEQNYIKYSKTVDYGSGKSSSKGSSSSRGYSDYTLSNTSIKEDIVDAFDFRSEEQKAKDEEKKQEKQVEKNTLHSKEYYGNVIKIDDVPITFDRSHRERSKDGSIETYIYDGGTIKEWVKYEKYSYKINSKEYTITKFLSSIFPEKLDHTKKSITIEVPLKDLEGNSINTSSVFFKLLYNIQGKLNGLQLTHKPYVSKKSKSPVITVVDDELCTFPIDNKNFKSLCLTVEKNGGKVEYPTDTELPEIVELAGENSEGGCIIL